MSVVLKMRCSEKSEPQELLTVDGPRMAGHLLFDVTYADTPENKEFFAATPSGEARFWTVNKAAQDFFDVNEEYYVTFTKARKE